MTTPSERAIRRAGEAIRVLSNDDGVWGIDIQGMWFPCDGDDEDDVREMAEDMRRVHATDLDTFAAEGYRAGQLAMRERAADLIDGETCAGETCDCFTCPMLRQQATAIRALAPEEPR